MKYVLIDSETNNVIFGEFATREEAEQLLKELGDGKNKVVKYIEGHLKIVEIV